MTKSKLALLDKIEKGDLPPEIYMKILDNLLELFEQKKSISTGEIRAAFNVTEKVS